jgi:hypothetical protein
VHSINDEEADDHEPKTDKDHWKPAT